jgi:2-methylcitrate dehydratase PrpD
LFPPLLALGERLDLGVDEILPAFAVGFELQQRICLAIFPSVHDRRWHNTAIVGAIGAAAACGRLLRLPPHTIAHAVGIAANSAGGFASSYGTMSKSVNIGRAAARGLESAWLAQRGVQSHPDTLGEGGFLQMFDAAPRAIDTGFGDDWHLLRNGLKPYPCGVVAHGAVDAARALRDRYPDPQRVAVRVSPAAVQLMGNVAPRNELEAKFSLPYVVAATWIAGELGPESFAADALADPRIRALMNRIEIIADPGMTQSEALLHVEDAGSVTQLHLPHARGSLERPLSDADLLLKCDTGLRIAGIPARQLGRQLLNGSIPIRSMMTILSGGGSLPS